MRTPEHLAITYDEPYVFGETNENIGIEGETGLVDSWVYGTLLLADHDKASNVVQNVYSKVYIDPNHVEFSNGVLAKHSKVCVVVV